MKALVFHKIGDIGLETVPDPKIKSDSDAILRLTASAICGTDLHMVRGTLAGMKSGTILGHEGVGIVEEVGKQVRNFKAGDRVVVGSTIACGTCHYCRSGLYAQCNRSNPNGSLAGTAFFGGPRESGAFDGLQAEYARIPFANVNMVRIPDEISDDQAILVSDIFPTAFMAAEMAEIRSGDTVAVFGCGPVGLFAIVSAKHMGAGRVFAIDTIQSRLRAAQDLGAEIIDFNREDPVEALRELTAGTGVDRVIDAVGIDANCAHRGPAAPKAAKLGDEFELERKFVVPKAAPEGDHWHPGDAPSQVLRWAVEAVSKAGTLSIIGVYPETLMVFPIGKSMNKNLTLRMGNCNHRKYIPKLLEMIQAGIFDPTKILTQKQSLESVVDAYQHFDQREQGWVKVELLPKLAEKKSA